MGRGRSRTFEVMVMVNATDQWTMVLILQIFRLVTVTNFRIYIE